MSEVLAPTPPPEEDKQLQFLATRDLNLLSPDDKKLYLLELHKAMGISPFARAFDFLVLQGKTILYANRTAADQLARNNNIESEVKYAGPLRLGSIERPDIYCVELLIKLPIQRLVNTDRDGNNYYSEHSYRTITSVGAVAIGNIVTNKDGTTTTVISTGDALANSYMKAYTKAWRRGVLQIMGCGFPDESETDSIPSGFASTSTAPPSPRLLTPNPEPAPEPAPPTPTTVPSVRAAALPKPLPAARPPK